MAGTGTYRVAYMMSRFPKLTETFVLDEILELERRGATVEIYRRWQEHFEMVNAGSRPLVAYTRYTPIVNSSILSDILRRLLRRPRRYLVCRIQCLALSEVTV
jgi:hypothetical protein